MEEKNLNPEEATLTPEETEQAVTTAGEALEEIIAADGMIGEAAFAEEMGPNDELTDDEAEDVTGGFSMHTPLPTMTPTAIMTPTATMSPNHSQGVGIIRTPDGRIIRRGGGGSYYA